MASGLVIGAIEAGARLGPYVFGGRRGGLGPHLRCAERQDGGWRCGRRSKSSRAGHQPPEGSAWRVLGAEHGSGNVPSRQERRIAASELTSFACPWQKRRVMARQSLGNFHSVGLSRSLCRGGVISDIGSSGILLARYLFCRLLLRLFRSTALAPSHWPLGTQHVSSGPQASRPCRPAATLLQIRSNSQRSVTPN